MILETATRSGIMNVGMIMTPALITITGDEPMGSAARRMRSAGIRHLPVTDHGRLVGMLSDRDVLDLPSDRGEVSLDAETGRPHVARDFMQATLDRVAPEDDVASAADILLRRRVGCLPVMRNDSFVGVLSDIDVIRAYMETCREEAAVRALDPFVGQVMTREIVSVPTDWPIDASMRLVLRERIRHLPVLHDGWFVGWVSDRDLRRALGCGRQDAPVEEFMTRHVISVSPAERLTEAARWMVESHVSAAPVTEAGRLVGVVTTSDVLRHCSTLDWNAGHRDVVVS